MKVLVILLAVSVVALAIYCARQFSKMLEQLDDVYNKSLDNLSNVSLANDRVDQVKAELEEKILFLTSVPTNFKGHSEEVRKSAEDYMVAHKASMSYAEISAKLNIPKSTLIRWANKLKADHKL